MINAHIRISDDIEREYESVAQEIATDTLARSVKFIKDDFKLEDAKAVVAEAYIAEEHRKYIIFGAKKFHSEAQNSLLKILEEPPENIIFIIIATSKAALLPTIRSRLSIHNNAQSLHYEKIAIDTRRLDNATLFSFIKKYESLKSHEAKAFLQQLLHHITQIEGRTLTLEQTEAFERAFYLVNLNGRFQVILVHLMMTFLPQKSVR